MLKLSLKKSKKTLEMNFYQYFLKKRKLCFLKMIMEKLIH